MLWFMFVIEFIKTTGSKGAKTLFRTMLIHHNIDKATVFNTYRGKKPLSMARQI